jgi:hypothetical protein
MHCCTLRDARLTSAQVERAVEILADMWPRIQSPHRICMNYETLAAGLLLRADGVTVPPRPTQSAYKQQIADTKLDALWLEAHGQPSPPSSKL